MQLKEKRMAHMLRKEIMVCQTFATNYFALRLPYQQSQAKKNMHMNYVGIQTDKGREKD
jgi:hypothetical protein